MQTFRRDFISIVYVPFYSFMFKNVLGLHSLRAEDPAHWMLSCRDPRGWSMPKGRPYASWFRGLLSEGYGHGGLGVCLGDGQTEAEGVPSQGGRGDALLRRMPPNLT